MQVGEKRTQRDNYVFLMMVASTILPWKAAGVKVGMHVNYYPLNGWSSLVWLGDYGIQRWVLTSGVILIGYLLIYLRIKKTVNWVVITWILGILIVLTIDLYINIHKYDKIGYGLSLFIVSTIVLLFFDREQRFGKFNKVNAA